MEKTRKRGGSFLGELFESLLVAVILALIIRLFIFQPFVIPSGSMEPTLQVNDRIITLKFSYRFGEPDRGDVVVFKYPRDPKRAFVKRVIGLGGETVTLQNSTLYVDGEPVSETYLPPGLEFADFELIEVPDGHLFVLGDNRNNSDDSRQWGFVSEDLLIGKSVAIYWPFERVSTIH